MAIYVITGKLGGGKSLCAVGRIRDYIAQGRRVATNLDLRLEHLGAPSNRSARVVRIPDKPTVTDLENLGLGSDVLDEDKYGALVLDELGAWLNAREWADKGRQALIDWLLHSRKKRWDVFFIVQDQSLLDKQVRTAMMEFLVTCKRLDRYRIPFFGELWRSLTLGYGSGNMPKMHLAVVLYTGGSGTIAGAAVSDRWLYRGRDLYPAYDTEQVFKSPLPYNPHDSIEDRRRAVDSFQGAFSYLTPWHLTGRYGMSSLWDRLCKWWHSFDRPKRSGQCAEKLRPFMGLTPDVRWALARRYVATGKL